MLRDSLGSVYRSSAKAKKRRRTENSVKVCDNIESVINLLSDDVSQTITQLSIDIRNPKLSDEEALELFTVANCNLLDAFKRDKSLVAKFFQTDVESISVQHGTNNYESTSSTSSSTAMEVLSSSNFEDDDERMMML